MDETMADTQAEGAILTTCQPSIKLDTRNDVFWSNGHNVEPVAVEQLMDLEDHSLLHFLQSPDLPDEYLSQLATQYESIPSKESSEEDILNCFRNGNGLYRTALNSTDNFEMQLSPQQPNSPQSTLGNPPLPQVEPYSLLYMWNGEKVNDKHSTMPNSQPLPLGNPQWPQVEALPPFYNLLNGGKVKDKFSAVESVDHVTTCTDQYTDIMKSILNNSVVPAFDGDSCDTDMTVSRAIKQEEELNDNHRTCLSPNTQVDARVANERTDVKMENIEEFIDKDGDTLLHIILAKHWEKPNLAPWLRSYEAIFKPFVNISDKKRQTPLHIAVFLQNVELVRVLMDFGADLFVFDSCLSSPIHVALEKTVMEIRENLSVRKTMLEVMLSKTRPSIIAKVIDSLNESGLAAIHLASEARDLEIMRILIKYGADINKQEGKSGYTSLMKVIRSAAMETDPQNSGACFKLAKSIITQLRPNVNICSYSNDSPLHLACACDNRDLVVTLLNENAKVNEKNIDRKSEKDLTSDPNIKNALEKHFRKKRRNRKKEACEA